jgi:hypothetical protein
MTLSTSAWTTCSRRCLPAIPRNPRGRIINEILEQEEGIAMASEVLMSISRDEAERARLMSEFKYQMDTQSKIGYARREGREEILRDYI